MIGDREVAPVSQVQRNEQAERRAVVYARTSTASQQFGYSIDEQVRQCVKRCHALDWSVLFVYRDEAESGKNPDRPMFQELLTRAEQGVIDVVVFWKLDRFSRSIMHAVQLEKKFRDWGVGLHSMTEQIDTTTASGQFNFRNLANTAEFEREMISQRTKMGLAARAMEGKWPNGTPPLGYQPTASGRLRVDDSEAELVRWVFDRYIETKSMAEVADKINADSDRATGHSKWTASTISSILRNELYIGVYTVGDVERSEPNYRIVSEDQFDTATAVRTRFQSSGSHTRRPMSERRKQRRVDRIRDQYREWLH